MENGDKAAAKNITQWKMQYFILYVIADKALQLIHILHQMPKVHDPFITGGIGK